MGNRFECVDYSILYMSAKCAYTLINKSRTTVRSKIDSVFVTKVKYCTVSKRQRAQLKSKQQKAANRGQSTTDSSSSCPVGPRPIMR